VARLTKHDVEQLMDLVDRDPVPVLTRMLGKVLDQPDARWETLVARAGFSPDRAANCSTATETRSTNSPPS
jgi:hypothetical protein